MPNKQRSRLIIIFALSLAAAGLLLQFWPIEILAIVAAVFGGMPIFALALGLTLDLIYGMPLGGLHYIMVPFAALALVLVLVRAVASRFVIDRYSQGTL
jgi:hypothetical protein